MHELTPARFDNTRLLVKILLHLILLFGAMTGLMGQSTAMAMRPVTAVSTTMTAMVGRSDCPEMASPMRGDTPCKKITWQCIAAMGCGSAAIALPSFMAEAAPHAVRLPHVRPVVATMLGRSVAPEIDPPAFLI